MGYGEMLRSMRIKKEVTLRELSAKSGVDVAYISRVERETRKPPQNEEILDSLNVALELDEKMSAEMKIQAAIDNKMIPDDIVAIKGIPLFIKTVARKRLSERQLRKIIDFINKEY